MPRPRTNEVIKGQYFTWALRRRADVYTADGRGNNPSAGRHSLRTWDRREALDRLRELDLVRAVDLGLADRALLKQATAALVPLDEGRTKYLEHVSRPAIAGGATARTVRRYEAIFDKFVAFAAGHKIGYWQQVDKTVIQNYGRWLEDNDYKPRTLYIELTTVKQAIKWMVEEGLLLPTHRVTTRLKKVKGTNTYCYSPGEVRAVIAYCRGREDLNWLADVVTALATTGLRIGELSDLRWANVDFARQVIHLRDTSGLVRKSERKEAQTTKPHRDRVLPVHPDLLPVLRRLYETRRPDQRVFRGPRDGRLKADTVRVVLQRDVLAALAEQFPGADGRPGIAAGRVHSFRHYFASAAANAGVPEQVLMDWLGHQESRMIRHYYHLQRDESRRQMGKIPVLGAGCPPSGPVSDGATG